MKDHPHLRGAAKSYGSLKEAFLPLAPFIKDDEGNGSESRAPFHFSLVAHHIYSPPCIKRWFDLAFLKSSGLKTGHSCPPDFIC